jgi:ParB/RepB/Spo0J family partition protein
MIESKEVSIDSIHPNDWNPNIMKGSVYEFLKKSIQKYGFVQPVIVTPTGVIIDGEHRWKACKEIGKETIEVKVLDISDSQAMQQTINFNLTRGVLDSSKLGKLLLALEKELGRDVLAESVALERRQVEKAIKVHQSSPSEEIQCETAKTTDISVGDSFALGVHTLYCGDALQGEADFDADITLTDPPYNVGYGYSGYMDTLEDTAYKEFIFRYVTRCRDVSPFVIITPGKVNEHYYYSMFKIEDTATWYKGFALTHGICSKVMVTEPILFIGEKPKNRQLNTDYLNYHTDREEGLLEMHSCPKPLGLFKELITSFTGVGDTVYDPFCGSGTTLIAAELTDRICVAHEIDPLYVQTIIDRYEKYTGRKAEKL